MSYFQKSYSNKNYRNDGYQSVPVELGKEYEADIAELSRRGDGIAKIKGFVVFISNTKPGDHVKFKVTRVANRFATAEVI
jgi:predicted RNA-binding protein with TRAM domain